MTQPPRTAREVFYALVHGVADRRYEDVVDLYAEQTRVEHPFDPLRAPALRSHDDLRAHFRPAATGEPKVRRQPANITVHDTTDPEVIVAEFEYQGTVVDTGEPFSLPCIFVVRVRDGHIVASRDYFDYLASARALGQLDELVAAIEATSTVPTDSAGR
jgi:ketosteroid isomerase-like protein